MKNRICAIPLEISDFFWMILFQNLCYVGTNVYARGYIYIYIYIYIQTYTNTARDRVMIISKNCKADLPKRKKNS